VNPGDRWSPRHNLRVKGPSSYGDQHYSKRSTASTTKACGPLDPPAAGTRSRPEPRELTGAHWSYGSTRKHGQPRVQRPPQDRHPPPGSHPSTPAQHQPEHPHGPAPRASGAKSRKLTGHPERLLPGSPFPTTRPPPARRRALSGKRVPSRVLPAPQSLTRRLTAPPGPTGPAGHRPHEKHESDDVIDSVGRRTVADPSLTANPNPSRSLPRSKTRRKLAWPRPSDKWGSSQLLADLRRSRPLPPREREPSPSAVHAASISERERLTALIRTTEGLGSLPAGTATPDRWALPHLDPTKQGSEELCITKRTRAKEFLLPRPTRSSCVRSGCRLQVIDRRRSSHFPGAAALVPAFAGRALGA